MSKYNCISCGEEAYYNEFYKKKEDSSAETVYAYCKSCGKEAWGGMHFHPAMNELFNKLFMPNWDFKPEDSKDYERIIILQPE